MKTALIFHDYIYDTTRKDSEERSANGAKAILVKAGATEEFQEKVHDLVMATRHIGTPKNFDEAVIRDVDLANLARPYLEYREIGNLIRMEYSNYNDQEFNEGRIQFLEGFLRKDRFYFTEEFYSRFETQARHNLVRELRERKNTI